MKTYRNHYINGAWQAATSPAYFEVHDASTEEVMATVPQGTAEEAAQAVLAAHAAFPPWSALSVEERCQYIDNIVAGLKARTDEMAKAIAREVGMPIKLASEPNHPENCTGVGCGLHGGAQTQRNCTGQRDDIGRDHS